MSTRDKNEDSTKLSVSIIFDDLKCTSKKCIENSMTNQCTIKTSRGSVAKILDVLNE